MPYSICLRAKQGNHGCLFLYLYGPDDLSAGIAKALANLHRDEDLTDICLVNASLSANDEAEGFETTETEGLLRYVSRIFWELEEEDEKDFVFPHGIIPANGEESDEIVEGFHSGHEPNYFWVEAVVDGRRFSHTLKSCFDWLATLDPLAEPDGLEVRLLHHWEHAATTEIWVRNNPPFWEFVEDHARDLIENGFVEVAFYSRAIGVMLRCTEHRTIVCTSSQEHSCQAFMEKLKSMGLNAIARLRTITYGFQGSRVQTIRLARPINKQAERHSPACFAVKVHSGEVPSKVELVQANRTLLRCTICLDNSTNR